MALSPQFLDEVRARTTLSALIGQSIKLERAGREFKACCPFHSEKSASFYVNDDKGFYHCFGCSAHGDAIRWLCDQRGLPFIDAVKELSAAAGLEMPALDSSPALLAREEQSVRLFGLLDRAARWYAAQLDQAGAVREYLHDRGIGPTLIDAFGLGWAPGRRFSVKAGLAGADRDDLVAAGLINDDQYARDFLWERVTIPIRDARGRTCGFAARTIGDAMPKYLNSRDGMVFDKGRLLFNLDRAGSAARSARRLVIVEGQFDCIGLSGVGIDEAVAPMGTSLTIEQLRRAWRVANRPVLLFDGDSAGRKAAFRACELAMVEIGPGASLSIALCPKGTDPDSLARTGGRDAIESVLSAARPLNEYLFDAVVALAA